MNIAGVVLAGGRSSRYGKPKMFETYEDKYFYQYSVEALKQNSISPIVIATNEKLIQYFEQGNVEFIIEEESDEYQGPLFAMYNAFSKITDAEWFFVLASDIPFVSTEFVKKMIDKAERSHSDAIVPIYSNTLQPLFALYHRRNLIKMEQLLTENKRKLQLLLKEINLLTVPFSSNESIFTNINSPEDWDQYKK
ncbi:molybdenum cofactor guanylyltransferase [Gottfriedia solisilvae]|uniref:Probable molybdenum cofactor guanylyltransferase n=1 Tax=Gottfriedia solisilvae TaxID=1516104 RepID=A0A8J3AQA0_9BACI|nr:molybdenum cofactor guanylyltransferase [Gottfriedia solisilvae]GGI17819.1 putative molybdenum cofactor guanylyltransferase [Gottfriedia solisilvae]